MIIVTCYSLQCTIVGRTFIACGHPNVVLEFVRWARDALIVCDVRVGTGGTGDDIAIGCRNMDKKS